MWEWLAVADAWPRCDDVVGKPYAGWRKVRKKSKSAKLGLEDYSLDLELSRALNVPTLPLGPALGQFHSSGVLYLERLQDPFRNLSDHLARSCKFWFLNISLMCYLYLFVLEVHTVLSSLKGSSMLRNYLSGQGGLSRFTLNCNHKSSLERWNLKVTLRCFRGVRCIGES